MLDFKKIRKKMLNSKIREFIKKNDYLVFKKKLKNLREKKLSSGYALFHEISDEYTFAF